MRTLLRLAVAFFGFFAVCAQSGYAQTQPVFEKCGTVPYMEDLRAKYPQEVETDAQFEERLAQVIAEQNAAMAVGRNFDDVMYIPIVFHIIHQGQPVGTWPNIPDAQIFSQLKVANQDFRRIAGSRGFNSDTRGADTRIEFVLAKRNPQGLPTTGINRIAASSLGLTGSTYTSNQMNSLIKPRTIWDPTRYYNVWVSRINNLYGFAQFPSNSALPGMACTPTQSSATTDGLFISNTAFGSLDDGNFTNMDPLAAYGRTFTHETGHWLGLRHIWGDANCGTDYCEDTPIHASANTLVCPTHPKPNNCGTADEMFENYMDYSDDRCVNIFTRDQMIRMRAVLTTCPRRRELINSIALVPPVPVDAGLAQILSPLRDFCTGTTSAKVVIKNWGTTNLTSVDFSYRLGNGIVRTFPQTLNLAAGAIDTLSIDTLTLPAGVSTLSFWTSNPNGVVDTNNLTDTIRTIVKVGAGIPLPIAENFEGLNTPPDYWSIFNQGGDCKQWRMNSVPKGASGERSVAALFGFFQNAANASLRDELTTPLIDLSGDTSAYMYFDVAHTRVTASTSGTLRIEVSTDCGATWNPTPVYAKTGAALTTVTGTQTSEFFPTAANQWRKETVNLRAYAGQTIRLRFVTTNTGGNNLFIDNIVFARAVPPPPAITRMVPDSGIVGGNVIIYGRSLATASSVSFNGTLSFNVRVLSDTSITTIVPSSATTGRLAVTTAVGVARSAGDFTVIGAPTIQSFSPTNGLPGTQVVITGTNLNRIRKVYFNGMQVASFTINSATRITTRVPVGATTGKIAVVSQVDSVLSATPFGVGVFLTIRNGSDTSCTGTLTTPGFPGEYSNNQNLTYRLYAPAGQQIVLTLTSFNTEQGYDYITIYNGPNASGATLLPRTSGTLSSLPTLTSTGGVITIVFTTDNSGTTTGLSATVRCTPPPTPTITALTPRQGPVGYSFGITGTSLLGVDSVWFGSTPVTSFNKTATRITGLVPSGAVTSTIRIKGALGGDTSNQLYTVTEGLAYCQPVYSACNATTGLRRISINGTTLATSTVCTDASGPAFTIYPKSDSATADVKSGGLMTITVNAAGAGQQIGAWADVNRNGVFETTEFYAALRQPTSGLPGLISMLLPSSIDTGKMGIRIRSRATLQGQDACTAGTNGSAADFTVRVVPCQAVAAPTGVLTDTICLGDTAQLQAFGAGLPYWFANTTTANVQDTGRIVEVQPTTTTTYFVAMESGSCFSSRIPVEVKVNPLPIAAFTAVVNELSVAQSALGVGNSYQWYLDGQPIAGANGLTYTIEATGSYALEVINSSGCSLLSASQLITFTSVQKEIASRSLEVRPNPSQGLFTITYTGGSSEGVVQDVLGRNVWSGTLAGSVKLDLATYGKGIYVLRAGQGVSVRLVVE